MPNEGVVMFSDEIIKDDVWVIVRYSDQRDNLLEYAEEKGVDTYGSLLGLVSNYAPLPFLININQSKVCFIDQIDLKTQKLIKYEDAVL